MTTPADNTPIGIITDALIDAGKIQQSEVPTGELLASSMRRLRDKINYFMTKGLKLFLWVDTSVTLIAGTNKYSFSPTGAVVMTKPLRAIDAYYLDSNSVRTPLTMLSWTEWDLLDHSQSGAVNQYLIDKQATTLDLYLYLIPDTTAATGTVHVLLQTQATQPVTLTETIAFPTEWRLALRWALASEAATGQPQSVINRCDKWAMFYQNELENWDVEDAPTRFQPDQRAAYYTSRFR